MHDVPRPLILLRSGCAKGVFVQSMAQAHPDVNFLGLEIRRPVAASGLSKLMALGLRNCHLVCCNVNVSVCLAEFSGSRQPRCLGLH